MNGNFTVKAIGERPKLSAAGELVLTTVIYIETVRGATGSVELPTRDYEVMTDSPEGKDTLRQILAKKAASLDAPFEL